MSIPRWKLTISTLAVASLALLGCDAIDDVLATADGEEAGETVEQTPEPPSEEPPVDDEPAAPETPEDPAESSEGETGEEEPSEQAGAAAGGQAPCTAADSDLPAELPDEAVDIEVATGDMTGDGQPDELITYRIDAGGTSTHYLRMVAASGYVAEANLDQAGSIAPVRPLGATSLGGERQVAFIVEDSSASGLNVSLWGLHDWDDDPCAFLRVTIPDDSFGPVFAIGGSVGSASGLTCDGEALLLRTLQSAGADASDWAESSWQWPDAGALVSVSSDEGTFASDADIPAGYLEMACDGIEQP